MSEAQKPVIITVDGPAGAGKSTVARALSVALNYSYLDTGAMYRALTLKAMRGGTDLSDQQALVRLAGETVIEMQGNPQSGIRIFLDGEEVTGEIRSQDVTNHTGPVACTAGVREIMVEWQRRMGRHKSLVIEGRDTGTVVFPGADYKFYLDADPDERTRRRMKEWKEKGMEIDENDLRREIARRDEADMQRDVSPLKKADDAIVIDTTGLSVDQTVEKMMKIIEERA